jgi:serine protease Do
MIAIVALGALLAPPRTPAASPAGAPELEVLDLGSGRSLTGTIVKRTGEHVFVDLGYTILEVPRREIVAIEALERPEQDGAAVNEARDASGLFFRAQRPEAGVRENVERVGEGVVLIKVPGALGSGFVIDADGWVVTNAHVVSGEQAITVTVFEDGPAGFEKRVFEDVELVALNEYWDLALLRIPAEDLADVSLTAVPLGRMDSLEVGDTVFAIGNPHGLERSVSEGSRLRWHGRGGPRRARHRQRNRRRRGSRATCAARRGGTRRGSATGTPRARAAASSTSPDRADPGAGRSRP